MLAAIRPQGKPEGTWALPKGNLDPGETPAETAVREVLEETGVHGRLVEKLGDVKYTYTRRDGTRVFKIVSFYLLQAGRGRLGAIADEMRIEVADARWLPLEDAPRLLAYGGEREMAAKARDRFVPD
jgi:8-oxo-dGTP pyrophosphatase MutT (NUDIX family)